MDEFAGYHRTSAAFRLAVITTSQHFQTLLTVAQWPTSCHDVDNNIENDWVVNSYDTSARLQQHLQPLSKGAALDR
eukprot:5242196-Pyramimonas_sp.AAC.1